MLTSSYMDSATGFQLFFKNEALNKTGSFKARGAANAVLSLSDEEVCARLLMPGAKAQPSHPKIPSLTNQLVQT